MSELTVILKDAERTYRKKFMCYNIYSVDTNDTFINECISDAKKDFLGQPDDVIIKISMSL